MTSNSVAPEAEPRKIMLIRHAEKPNDGPPFGVKEDGTVNKHSIVVRGWQRAGALVQFFANPTHPTIATPDMIFAATTTLSTAVKPEDAKSLRPQETIGPVAAKLGCPRNADISVGDEPRLIAALRRTPGVVLVAWEHKRIPAIASAFASVPHAWSDDVFDVVWVLDRRPDGAYDFSVVQQNLLSGDNGPAQRPAPHADERSMTE